MITPALRPPSLLSASKQICREALYLWYTHDSNEFEAEIKDCDVSLILAFRILVTKSLGRNAEINVTFFVVGINWHNLLQWCRHVWSEELLPSTYENDDGELLKTIYAAHRIAELGRVHTWDTCKLHLEAMRVVAGLSDKKWLDD